MDATAAWFLNLDAELELAAPLGYSPSQRARALIERQATKLERLTCGGLVLGVGPVPRGIARGRVGHAWCPTPYALRQLERAGAQVPCAPELAVLQRVNHRRFCAELGQTLDRAQFFERAEELLAFLERYSEDRWQLKRGFGFAGRGQRTTRPTLDADDRKWIAEAFRYGGVQVEPWVQITQELAVHGHVSKHGLVILGQITVQQCAPDRSWLSSELSYVDEAVAARLQSEARACAERLYAEGYFGPFGVDAYHYRSHTGQLLLNPRSEINARYTMGYAVGMGHLPELTGSRDP